MNRFRSLASRTKSLIAGRAQTGDAAKFASGQILSRMNRQIARPVSLRELEFRVFSQFSDDGIIDWLAEMVSLPFDSFVEFGVENYTESNTRFLLMNRNWVGLVLDGSSKNIDAIRKSDLYWKHSLHAEHAFVTRENINDLIRRHFPHSEIGLLHVDIDGNDYWVWDAIDVVRPAIAVIEYNAVFGGSRAITVPYQADFVRQTAHHSRLYFGASLPALQRLAERKDYRFIGTNSNGNNAYFVSSDFMTPPLEALASTAGFVDSRFRESRDPDGRLTFRTGDARRAEIAGLPVFNIETGELEPF